MRSGVNKRRFINAWQLSCWHKTDEVMVETKMGKEKKNKLKQSVWTCLQHPTDSFVSCSFFYRVHYCHSFSKWSHHFRISFKAPISTPGNWRAVGRSDQTALGLHRAVSGLHCVLSASKLSNHILTLAFLCGVCVEFSVFFCISGFLKGLSQSNVEHVELLATLNRSQVHDCLSQLSLWMD